MITKEKMPWSFDKSSQPNLKGMFIMLYKVALTFESVDPNDCMTIQMKDTDQYFLVGLFIVLYKVALTFDS